MHCGDVYCGCQRHLYTLHPTAERSWWPAALAHRLLDLSQGPADTSGILGQDGHGHFSCGTFLRCLGFDREYDETLLLPDSSELSRAGLPAKHVCTVTITYSVIYGKNYFISAGLGGFSAARSVRSGQATRLAAALSELIEWG